LRIQTRRRLVKKDQKLRTSSQFNTDGESLSLLNIQALTGNSNNSVRELLHVKHINYMLDILKLLFSGDLCGLAKNGTKLECLSDCHGIQVKILLLHIADSVLE
jgi:hypothetical protein